MTDIHSLSIASFLSKLTRLSQAEINLIASLFKLIELKATDFFIEYGKPIGQIGFVVKGILFKHDSDENGNLKVEKFICEGHFFTDREGYIEDIHSKPSIQALSNCSLFVMPMSDFKRLKADYPHIAEVINEILSKNFIEQFRLTNHLLTGCVSQRIERFKIIFAKWVDLIPDKLMASYLDISESSISHIHK